MDTEEVVPTKAMIVEMHQRCRWHPLSITTSYQLFFDVDVSESHHPSSSCCLIPLGLFRADPSAAIAVAESGGVVSAARS